MVKRCFARSVCTHTHRRALIQHLISFSSLAVCVVSASAQVFALKLIALACTCVTAEPLTPNSVCVCGEEGVCNCCHTNDYSQGTQSQA